MVALDQAKINRLKILNMRRRSGLPGSAATSTPLSSGTRYSLRPRRMAGGDHVRPDHGRDRQGDLDGYVASRDWAKANRDFMVKFVKVMADAGCEISRRRQNWKADGAG